MDCNREEAIKAKEIAEKKFTERDIAGAKKFAMKAQSLFPELDGLYQFLATLDVYISAEQRTNGEVDWYKVLGVGPSADDDTIRKQYRKLVLSLHPDKNKSIGADGAFRIVAEAWSLLSDKSKRIAYDGRRNLRHAFQKFPNWRPSVPPGRNGFHSFSNNNISRMHKMPAPHFSKPGTFWTTCNTCKTQFEYIRQYLNQNLLCRNCRQHFLAVETTPPPLNSNVQSTMWSSHMQANMTNSYNSTQHVRTENSYTTGMKPVFAANMGPGLQSSSFFKMRSVGNVPSTASLAAQPEKMKRKHDEAPMAAVREETIQKTTHPFEKPAAGLGAESSNAGPSVVQKGDRPKKKRCIDEHTMNIHGRETASKMANGYGGVHESGCQKIRIEIGKGKIYRKYKSNSIRELPQEIKNILLEKAKKDISGRLKEWRTVTTGSNASMEEMEEKGKKKDAVHIVEADANTCPGFGDRETKDHINESFVAGSGDDPDRKVSDLLSMSVPDPDFHDFDKDRTERSFAGNQVWAAYDDDDGMPRYYAMIHSVISFNPFKVRMSWLNSKSNRELAPLNWIGSGFYKTSGDFWIGKHEANSSLNSFSHKVVKWTKGTRGAIRIYPSKGDVWAVYRNWSPDWNEHTADEVIHKYDMVEVLEDYEERGSVVAPLVKVAGFRTVFRRHSDPNRTRVIPREEMFRFSHHVPSYMLTGHECHNAPKGCLELDPASTPLELLQVLTEVREEEAVETTLQAEEKEPFMGMKKSEEEQLSENGETTMEVGAPEDDSGNDAAEVSKNNGKKPNGLTLKVYERRRKKTEKAGGSIRFYLN